MEVRWVGTKAARREGADQESFGELSSACSEGGRNSSRYLFYELMLFYYLLYLRTLKFVFMCLILKDTDS